MGDGIMTSGKEGRGGPGQLKLLIGGQLADYPSAAFWPSLGRLVAVP